MFAASRSSNLFVRKFLSAASSQIGSLKRKNTASKIVGRDFRLLSTLLPASFGTTLHFCSLEGNTIESSSKKTLASYNASMNPKKGWLSRFMSSSTKPTTLKDEIDNLIDSHKVVIFSKSYCPYCSATKKLFNKMKVEGMVVIELDQDPRGAEIQQELQRMTGQRTVPNVFVNGSHLGGNSDAQAAAQSGKLQEMLN
ncbi:glutaredoxin [Nitzschia inconspicua]|uniref:Glutaredoxin n=1 Tax=Nitzschia inconspicua TaxID=303405 RepID=A0A9K3LHR1_9STRA|nr:glutaredoxin [Nitzschia inconspicua]